jgi:beta-phosphoglucomutase
VPDWPLAILFDFDGVIVNSEPLHCRAFQQVLSEQGISLSDEDYYREMIGFDDRGGFHYLFTKHSRPIDAGALARLIDRKAGLLVDFIARGEYEAMPGAVPLVKALAEHYPLAICSGALRQEIESMLAGVGLRECFRTIVAAEDVAVGKPDPQGYKMTAGQIGQLSQQQVRPADCLVIEDAPSVIRSVKSAGFRTLGVATSYPLEQLSEADWAVPSLEPAVVRRVLPQLRLNGSMEKGS